MSIRPLVLLSLLAACGGSSRTNPELPSGPPRVSGGDRVTGAIPPVLRADGAAVRAVERRPMPTCEAGDLHALSALPEGLAARPAIAAHGNGALVAFVNDAQHDGTPELTIIAVDPHGAPRGAATVVDTGPNPAFPALIANGDSYVLAWREGAPGSERIVARNVAANGTVANTPLLFEGITGHWLGAPALASRGEATMLAVVSATNAPHDPDDRRGDAVEWARLPDRTHGREAAPAGGEFDASRPPVLLSAGDRVRLFVASMAQGARPGASRALLEMTPGAASNERERSVVATDVASPRGYTDGANLFLSWRSLVGPHDVAARVWALDGDTPPVTVATFRGAQDAEVALLPIGEGLLGAFTISTLADDDGGTLNVSVVSDRGQFVGRQPLLVSSLVRSAAVVAASTDDAALFVIEGRADNGHDAVLGIAPVQCSTANHADPLQVPPAGLIQRLGSLDEPAAQLAHPIGSCTVAAPPQTVVAHRAANPDVLADSDASAVSLGASAVLFAVARESAGGPSRVAIRAIDAHGSLSPIFWTIDGARRLLTSARVGANAIALVSHGTDGSNVSIVSAAANGRARAPVQLPLVDATSAVFSDDGRTLFVVASSTASRGSIGLYRVAVNGARPGAPLLLAPLSAGDAVLDAAHTAHETTVLLARPDALGEAVSRALATLTVPDPAAAAARLAAHSHPFADPRGHGRGPAWLVHGANGLAVTYAEGPLLRAADIDHGAFRHARSVLGTFDAGGAPLARSASAADGSWLALSSGLPSDSSRVISPFSLVLLGPRGEVRVANSEIAANDHAIAGHASLARTADRVSVLYAQPEGNDGANWRVVQATCHEGTAPASSAPPSSSSPSASGAPAPSSEGGRR